MSKACCVCLDVGWWIGTRHRTSAHAAVPVMVLQLLDGVGVDRLDGVRQQALQKGQLSLHVGGGCLHGEDGGQGVEAHEGHLWIEGVHESASSYESASSQESASSYKTAPIQTSKGSQHARLDCQFDNQTLMIRASACTPPLCANTARFWWLRSTMMVAARCARPTAD